MIGGLTRIDLVRRKMIDVNWLLLMLRGSALLFLGCLLNMGTLEARSADSLLVRAEVPDLPAKDRVLIWRAVQRTGLYYNDSLLVVPSIKAFVHDTINDNAWSWLLYGGLIGSFSTLERSNACMERASMIFMKQGEELGYALAVADKAKGYSLKGEQAIALNGLFKALSILERTGPIMEEAEVWRALAFIFRYQMNFPKALEYYGKMIALGDSLGELSIWMNGYRGEAGVRLEQGRIREAEELYHKALELSERLGSDRVTAMVHVELANIRFEQGDMAMARERYREALKFFEDGNSDSWLSYTHSRIADASLRMNDLSAALDHGERGLAIAVQKGLLKEALDNLIVLPKVYATLGRFGEALDLSLRYEAYRDSMRNDVTATELTRLEIGQEQVKDSLLREEKRIQDELRFEANVAKAKQQRNIFLFIGLCVLVLVGGLWTRLRFTRRVGKEMIAANQLIEKELIRAESSEKVKDQFLANMSHEIRTPMNAIMGMTSILKRNERLPEQEKYLDAISQSSSNLLVILNDILDLGKIEDGKVELEHLPFEVRAAVINVVDILRFKAEEKGLILEFSVDGSVPHIVIGDGTRLGQILLNLVGNAIKFTEKGSVCIEVIKVEDVATSSGGEGSGDDPVRLCFKVRDTGIGIRTDRLGSIFEEFTQAYSDTTRKYGGTGLGLTITKRLVGLHGGEISVSSIPGEGSTFTVILPYGCSEDGPTLNDEGLGSTAVDLNGVRILLAEDNEFNVMVATDELQDAIPNVKVDVAINGRMALEMATTNEYDVVLMDIQMPEMNGFEATQEIRRLPGKAGKVPIIAMTANVLKSEVIRSQEVGMDGFVPKPFERKDLLEKMAMVIARGPSAS